VFREFLENFLIKYLFNFKGDWESRSLTPKLTKCQVVSPGAGFSGTGMERHGTILYRCTTGTVQVYHCRSLIGDTYTVPVVHLYRTVPVPEKPAPVITEYTAGVQTSAGIRTSKNRLKAYSNNSPEDCAR
jgi:hypothetical protein